jgi:hypothetical protein
LQVLRRRRTPLAIPLLTGALLAAAVVAAQDTKAQTSADPTGVLMSPVLDGNPQTPPRFRQSGGVTQRDTSRFGEAQNFDYRPALGAGTTGFDSTNVPKRKGKDKDKDKGKARQPAKPGGATTGAGSQQPGLPAPKADGTAKADTTAQTNPLALTPRQLQPAVAPLNPRLRLQNRPGAPGLDPGAVIATIATTPPSRRPPLEDKPFDPLGIQVGAFNVRPALEYSRGYDNNVPRNSGPPAASSWYEVYAPELLINSNWSRHELTANLRGSYTAYDTNHPNDRPTVDAKVNARVDVTSQTRIDLEGRYLLFTDNPGSPNIQADLVRLPIAMTYGSTVGVGHRFNRFDVSLKGTFDRTVYNDSSFDDGQTASNADRNFNQVGTQLRTSYEVTPGVKPFVELAADTRKYDLAVDAGGVNRSSEGRSAKLGTTIEATRWLTGELSVGYLSRGYQDPTLEDINGYSVDASLVWLWTALTTVKVTATTSVAESTVPGVSGNFTRDVTAQIEHAFRRWLIGTLKFSRGFDDYVGSEREDIRYVASGALAYYLTREIQLKGEYRQEWRYSNQPGNNYWAHVWLIGMRLQR